MMIQRSAAIADIGRNTAFPVELDHRLEIENKQVDRRSPQGRRQMVGSTQTPQSRRWRLG